MSFNLNFSNDQQHRIEEAQTPEEKAHIIADAAEIACGGIELSDEELEGISGGVRKPMSAEEGKKALEAVKKIEEVYGPEVAQITAEELGLI